MQRSRKGAAPPFEIRDSPMQRRGVFATRAIAAGVDDYVAKWINHSCDPNCDAVIEDKRI